MSAMRYRRVAAAAFVAASLLGVIATSASAASAPTAVHPAATENFYRWGDTIGQAENAAYSAAAAAGFTKSDCTLFSLTQGETEWYAMITCTN